MSLSFDHPAARRIPVPFAYDEGTFVFVRQQVWDTGVSTFSCEAPPRTISWPEGGNGTLHLLNPESEQWEEIGVVRPDAPAEEPRGEAPEGLPAPTPGPAGGDGYTANAKVLSGHRAAVVCIAFSGNGKILASSDAGGTLKIWDMQNGTEARSSQVAGITSLAFLDDALAVGLDGRHPDADRLQGMVAVVEDGRGGVNLESVQTRVESVAFMDGSLAAGGANMDFEAGREYGHPAGGDRRGSGRSSRQSHGC